MNRNRVIYLDHAATTPVNARVFAKMEPYFSSIYGNASSIYTFAQQARRAVDEAREIIASRLECKPREVIFTSGGTESNNLALLGFAEAYEKYGKHIITSRIEHDSVLKPLEHLKGLGFEITLLEVGEEGIVNPGDIKKALRPDTILISLMYANNEIGTIQPIAEIAQIIKNYKLQTTNHKLPVFHTDACQSALYLDISVKKLGVDSLSVTGGKIYGPKGIGFLYVREGLDIVPQLRGGGQEYRLRSGTENVPSIVGLAEAFRLATFEREQETKKLLSLRDQLIDGILQTIPRSRLNGSRQSRLPNNANISFYGLEAEPILLQLDQCGICVSAGSACTSGSLEPSHVIQALGLSEEWTHSSVRFTLGKENTREDVEYVLQELPKIIEQVRKFSPFAS